jgi:hypothetical protein
MLKKWLFGLAAAAAALELFAWLVLAIDRGTR